MSDAEILELGGRQPRLEPDRTSGRQRHLVGCGFYGQQRVRQVIHEELLHVVRRRAEHTHVVEPDQIHVPLRAAHLVEERRVSGHAHHIGVALEPSHDRSFAQRSLQVILAVTRVAGILAYIDFRAAAFIRVVTVRLRQEPLRRLVVVLVHQFRIQFRQPFPSQLKHRPFR